MKRKFKVRVDKREYYHADFIVEGENEAEAMEIAEHRAQWSNHTPWAECEREFDATSCREITQ